jgi:peptidoglycan/xylan/chitin deacetylase (PgdA/CDA1 family)
MSVVVLLYHKLLDDPARAVADPQRLSVAETTFQRQLSVLAAEAEVVPLRLALVRGRALGRSRHRYVCITFDDGYRTTLDRAAPALREAGVSATVFVSPGHASRPQPYWWDRLAALRETGLADGLAAAADVEPWLRSLEYAAASAWVDSLAPGTCWSDEPDPDVVPAGWDQLRRIDRSAFDVGCHALHHDCLAALPNTRLRRELRQAISTFRHERVAAIPALAYPYGYAGCVNTEQVREAVAPHFDWALSSVRGRLFEPGFTDPYFLPRVYAEEWAADRFRSELRRAFEPASV